MIASVLVLSGSLSAAPAYAAGPSSTDTSTAAYRISKAVEKGADPSITDNENHDAVYYCEWYGNMKLCQFLLEKEGKKTVSKDPVKPVATHLAKGQAVVHYLNHSGYAIETSRCLLVFDYFQPADPPSTPSLLNGRINPSELKGKKMIVFASHEHGDNQACSNYSSDIVKTFASQPTAFGTYPGDRFVYNSTKIVQ